MVIVPNIAPDTPPLKKNPVFLYYSDRFLKPAPFEPDLVVSIDEVMDQKLNALLAIESQFIEGGCNGNESMVPQNDKERASAQERLKRNFTNRFAGTANKYRDGLVEIYGEERGKNVKCAEAFEVCEYGSRPSKAELKKLFPFL